MSKKKSSSTYFEVDLWQKAFSRISVAAVFQIFGRKFNIPKHEMKKYSFQHCVESLRMLENENYTPHEGAIKKNKADTQISV